MHRLSATYVPRQGVDVSGEADRGVYTNYTFIHLHALVGFDIISGCSVHGYGPFFLKKNTLFYVCEHGREKILPQCLLVFRWLGAL
jgi:hypothetical protein